MFLGQNKYFGFKTQPLDEPPTVEFFLNGDKKEISYQLKEFSKNTYQVVFTVPDDAKIYDNITALISVLYGGNIFKEPKDLGQVQSQTNQVGMRKISIDTSLSNAVTHGESTPFSFSISTVLTEFGKPINEIEKSIFLVKERLTDEDANALVTKTLDTGLTLNSVDQSIVLEIEGADYDNLNINSTYKMVLAIQFIGSSEAVELEMSNNEFTVKQDGLRAETI